MCVTVTNSDHDQTLMLFVPVNPCLAWMRRICLLKVLLACNPSAMPQLMLLPYLKAIPRALKIAMHKTVGDVLFPNQMQYEEAKRILDLDNCFTRLDLDTKFQKFYEANSVQRGGSSYIQQKIKNAFDVLDSHQSMYTP